MRISDVYRVQEAYELPAEEKGKMASDPKYESSKGTLLIALLKSNALSVEENTSVPLGRTILTDDEVPGNVFAKGYSTKQILLLDFHQGTTLQQILFYTLPSC